MTAKDVRKSFPLRRGSLELRVATDVMEMTLEDGFPVLKIGGRARWYLCGVRLPRRVAWWLARRLGGCASLDFC